mmetsp:Transcript_36170/g.116467  ORF Transcript_36170/g.116467 Transcript_36170/m.116467 type:complete len:241 (+) Transcript_36170:532-1254(+)
MLDVDDCGGRDAGREQKVIDPEPSVGGAGARSLRPVRVLPRGTPVHLAEGVAHAERRLQEAAQRCALLGRRTGLRERAPLGRVVEVDVLVGDVHVAAHAHATLARRLRRDSSAEPRVPPRRAVRAVLEPLQVCARVGHVDVDQLEARPSAAAAAVARRRRRPLPRAPPGRSLAHRPLAAARVGRGAVAAARRHARRPPHRQHRRAALRGAGGKGDGVRIPRVPGRAAALAAAHPQAARPV